MMARGDHKIFHEPWNAVYLKRNGLLNNDKLPQELVEAGSYEGVRALFYRYAEERPVYSKDMVWATTNDLIDDHDLLADPDVVLSILIREPALSIESFFQKMSDNAPLENTVEYTRWVYRYDFLVKLAETYHEIRGKWPIIVEAEDLCTNPQAVMESYCQQAGIPFLPEALSWEMGNPEEWEHIAKWHIDASSSTGFFIPNRDAKTRFTGVPEAYAPRLETLYQEQKPYYEQLRRMKKIL